MGLKSPFSAVYDLDYYSGSQCSLYIGDVWVDEVTSLQYQIQQNKQPLYGYASQLFDATAAGQVLVQGNFTINFKEQGYLWAVLRRYFQIQDASFIITGNQAQKGNDAVTAGRLDRPFTAEALQIPTDVPSSNTNKFQNAPNRISLAGIERLLAGEATTTERYEAYDNMAGMSTFSVGGARDKEFENLMEAFEDQVWGRDITNNTLMSQLRRTDDNRFDGFDMYVVFGNYQNDQANHTVQKILGVRLLSQGKTINIDGMPIQEEYSFLARSVV